MRSLGNKIYVTQGEDFTLKFGQQTVAPLIIPAAYKYPFLVVTLRSTLYHQDEQYINVRWLDCKDVPKFTYTEIVDLGTSDEVPATYLTEAAKTRVFMYTDSDANKQYFYYKSNTSGTSTLDTDSKTTYQFQFLVHYDTDESCELVDRKYLGEVRLLNGEPMSTYLYSLVDKYELTLSETTMTAALNALINYRAKELENLDINKPLHTLTTDMSLLCFELYTEV